eukprot:3894222-Amphidinium_carterae.1
MSPNAFSRLLVVVLIDSNTDKTYMGRVVAPVLKQLRSLSLSRSLYRDCCASGSGGGPNALGQHLLGCAHSTSVSNGCIMT